MINPKGQADSPLLSVHHGYGLKGNPNQLPRPVHPPVQGEAYSSRVPATPTPALPPTMTDPAGGQRC